MLELAPGWEDISEELSDPPPPFTLSRPVGGKGAFQLSPAIFKSGTKPSMGVADLEDLCLDFARRRKLGEPTAKRASEKSPVWAGASYRSQGRLLRVWYVSDGANVALATYNTAQLDYEDEVEACEDMLSSITFGSKEPAR